MAERKSSQVSKQVKSRSDLALSSLLQRLRKHYAAAECSLSYENPFQLLIATILSAQCTDKRVNQVTPSLFKKYPTPSALANAPLSDIEKMIASTGFYKQKAKSLKTTSQLLVEKFSGEVPKTLAELTGLSGVGRKTANVVLGNAFKISSGVVVDTHVKRISNRLGLTRQSHPEKIEKELNELLPKEVWIDFPHWIIAHGRSLCTARSPRCSSCFLVDICPRKGLPRLPKMRN